jgi:hypothetical protein
MNTQWSVEKIHWIYFVSLGILLSGFIFFVDNGLENFFLIQTSKSILITDYLSVGGLYATLANVGLVLLLNLAIIRLSKAPLNGINIAALFTIIGFSFFGKNIINSLPIYLGVFLYSKIQNVSFSTLMPVMLFSSGLAPVVSFMMFGFGSVTFITITGAIATGIIAGLVLPEISQTVKPFHENLNLYNVGFSLGFIAIFVSVILRAFNVDLSSDVSVSTSYQTELWTFSLLMVLSFLVLSILFKPKKEHLKALFKSTGNEGDYTEIFGVGTTWLNVFFMGVISLFIIFIFDFSMNGPLIAGLLTVVGFGTFGKHPFNSIPVILGALLAVWLTDYTFESTGFMIAILFATALAPVSGKYGPLVGILAGFIHVLITPFAYILQGGFDLYNNGFAAGFAAMLVSSMSKVYLSLFHKNI